ncbi:MAG: calcium/sodium antiporter [bacterium]|nr:calcium/sodium antiporter [Acidimicrobiia bacterium]MCY4649055.1 calcium/sodium antiporter [bacterium]
MLVDVAWVVVGMAALIIGAERLVSAAERLAHYWGMSTVLIGAVVVGLGTSLPEMLISGLAAARPDGLDLAAGNIVGSNIANLSLVLGVSIILAPLKNVTSDLRREWLAMLAGSLVLVIAAWNNALSRPNGVILALAMVVALMLLVRWSRDMHSIEGKTQATEDPGPAYSEEVGGWLEKVKARKELSLGGLRLRISLVLWREILMALVSLVLTLWGADRLVDGATGIAERLNISGGLVGLTLVALGTSLPELATAVAAARHGNTELVIGNVLGSNLFNALAVGGIAGLVGDGAFTGNFRGSLLWMMGAAVAAGGIANGLRGFDQLRPFRSSNRVLQMMGAALATGDVVFSRWSQSRIAGVVLVAFYPLALLLAGL